MWCDQCDKYDRDYKNASWFNDPEKDLYFCSEDCRSKWIRLTMKYCNNCQAKRESWDEHPSYNSSETFAREKRF